MTVTQQEFEGILADDTKEIAQDVVWRDDEDHSPGREFRAAVASEAGYPLFVIGRYNAVVGTLTYAPYPSCCRADLCVGPRYRSPQSGLQPRGREA